MNRRQCLAAFPLAGLAGRLPAARSTARSWFQPRIVATGLHFPEAPVAMADGSLLFVEIEARTIARLSRSGIVSRVAQLAGGPNGLAIGPDKALYIANNGGRFTFPHRGPMNFVGPPPADHKGGMIQRMDLASGQLTTLYRSCDGRPLVAPDDLVFDRAGGMWITDLGKAPGDGGVYYALPDGSAIRQVAGGMNANGIGISPDGRRLHVTVGRTLRSYDITAPGVLATSSSYPDGVQARLAQGAVADSLKVEANGRVCVCTLFAGGVSVIDAAGEIHFMACDDPWTTNLAFGGPDLRDVWLTYSASGRIANVRWPRRGLAPVYWG